MNLNAVRAFVYTAETGSISAAAKRMGRSRVQLSQWITNLEVDWNTQLLNREGHKPELTQEGKKLLDECKQMLRMERFLNQKVEGLQHGYASELTIGISHYIDNQRLAKAVDLFNQSYPNIDCYFYNRTDEDLMSNPAQFNLSIGYYVDLYDEQTHIEPICQHTHMVVCSSDHPLASQDIVSILDLNQYPAIAPRKHTQMEYWPALPDQKCWFADSYDTCLALTKEGLTLLLTPRHRIEQELSCGELLVVNHPKAVLEENLGVIWQNTAGLSEPEEHLVSCIKKAFTA